MKRSILPLCLLGSVLMLPALAQTDPSSVAPAATADAAVTAPANDASVGASYQFQAIQQDDPLGTVYEVDFVDTEGHQTSVLEIPAGTKTLSPFARAKIIADRLQKASLADKLFWSKLKPTVTKNEYVVARPGEGFIMTADQASAALSGMHSEQFADFLLKGIKTALTGKLRDAAFDYALKPEEKLERANLYRDQGDKAFQHKDEARAEIMYLQAKKVAPDYAVAYLCLASLYSRQGHLDKAKEVLKEGLDNHLDLAAVAQQILPDQDQTLIPLINQSTKGS